MMSLNKSYYKCKHILALLSPLVMPETVVIHTEQCAVAIAYGNFFSIEIWDCFREIKCMYVHSNEIFLLMECH